MSLRRRLIPISLAVAFLLVEACQTPPRAQVPANGASKRPTAATSRGPAAASTVPTGVSSPSRAVGTRFVVPSRLLASPGGVAFKGRLTLDATYLVAAGAGNAMNVKGAAIVAVDGGTLISDGGGTLISDGGGTLISDGGGTLISDGGGTLIANARNQVVATGAGNLVASADARLIGADGATLIGADGGSLAGGRPAGYALAQATGGTGPRGAGDGKPVAGALIGAFDLRNGAAVPIGRDAKGAPVYLAYTNARGEYEVYLPPGMEGNVLLASSVPGKVDGRLTARAFGNQAKVGPVELSELQSGVVDYLRELLAARLEATLMDEGRAFFPKTFPEALYASMLEVADAIHADGQRLAFGSLGPAARHRVAQRVADALIARADVFGAHVLPFLPEPVTVSTEKPAIEGLLGSLGKVLDASARLLNSKGPVGFEGYGFFGLATQVHPKGEGLAIQKPSDLLDLLNEAFQAVPHEDYIDVSASAVVDLCVPAVEKDNIKVTIYSLYFAAVNALFSVGGLDAAKTALAEAMAAERAATRPEPAPLGVPLVPPSAPAVTVATLAGSGAAGHLDDVAGKAAFDRPVGLVMGENGMLYVSEQGAKPYIRRVDRDGRVATLALGDASPLRKPAGLALGPDGKLYVADSAAHAIFAIRDPGGAAPEIMTIAGTPGEAGPASDTDGAAARFDAPEGLAFGPDGALYVADRGNQVVRRIALEPARAQVTTWAGQNDVAGYRDDFGTAAKLNEPYGLAFVAGGPLIVSEHAGGLVRRVRLDDCRAEGAGKAGGVTVLAGLASRLPNGTLKPVDWPEARAQVSRGERPAGVAAGPDGSVFVADAQANVVRWFHPSLRWTRVLAGQPATGAGFADGGGGLAGPARFAAPAGLAVDPGAPPRTLYVADTGNHRIRKIVVN